MLEMNEIKTEQIFKPVNWLNRTNINEIKQNFYTEQIKRDGIIIKVNLYKLLSVRDNTTLELIKIT